MIIGMGGVVLSASVLWWEFRRATNSHALNSREEIFEIAQGDSLRHIAAKLGEQGILDHPRWFIAMAYWRRESSKLKFGEYSLGPNMSLSELLNLFVSGRVRQHSFTIVDGWTIRQLLIALADQPALDHRLAGKMPEEVLSAIGCPSAPAEGRFFPDTYFFPKGSRDAELLRRAARRMDLFLESEWQGRQPGLPYANAYEALVLASIVEKETSRDDERARVAGVLVRRLGKKMRLQTDPTVIYGMGESYAGNITRKDLTRDTPYNTYTREGLPPTPISLPGAASLHAALHPDTGGSLYFVARGDGSHVFSSTLPDHIRAVVEFQKQHHD